MTSVRNDGFSHGYRNTVYLTFDLDWAHDVMLEYVIDLLESHHVPATFFVTHDTPVLNRLRNNSLFELGIHPNFSPLIQGSRGSTDTPETVINELMELVPEAQGVRSHSLFQSSHILDAFLKEGLVYDVNLLLPGFQNLEPFRHCNGLKRLPFFWADDAHCVYGYLWDPTPLLNSQGLKIFNFHPIHVFLNTETLQRYEQAKNLQSIEQLLPICNSDNSTGTRVFLEKLLLMAKDKGFDFGLCKEIGSNI